MANVVGKSMNEGALYLEFSCDLSSGAAVGTIRGTGWTVTKTGTGQYTAVFSNPNREMFVEILNRFADLGGTPATAFWAKIVSVTQAATDPNAVTVVVNTLSNAATPVAADTTGACTLDCGLAIRTVRLVSPI